MKDPIEIHLMGPPEVSFLGKPVKFATRKALALFIYLIIEKGMHPREKLMAIFWPESKTQLAQSSLRNTIARIKDAFPEEQNPLMVEGDLLGVFPISALDLDHIRAIVDATQPLQPPPEMLARMQAAAHEIRGVFLEAFNLPNTPDFDDWVLLQRGAWQGRVNILFDRLSQHLLEQHSLTSAQDSLAHWLRIDPLNEIAIRRLMRLHFLNRDRSTAIQVYENFRKTLEIDLGSEPSNETQQLLAHIRSAPLPEERTQQAESVKHGLRNIPFVGRGAEFAALSEAYQTAAAGKLQIVAISGDSGIGKSRLADEFLIWVSIDKDPADVLRGRAYEVSGDLPYQPIIDAIRDRLDKENAPEDLLDDAWLVELTRILPELRERYPDLPPFAVDESTARLRLFEAITRLSRSLAARRPLVLLIDDLQWVDAGTLELLQYLSRNWKSNHDAVLLILLVREDFLHQTGGVKNWISAATREFPFTHIALQPVQKEDMLHLVQNLMGEAAEGMEELSAWLAVETSGHPFTLVEMLSSLNDYGALVWSETESGAAVLDALATLANLKQLDPASFSLSVQDVVLFRLDWISQPAFTLLSAAAIIGRDCSFQTLVQVAGMEEQNSLDALDELLAAHLILEDRQDPLPYLIAHDRIREVVYGQLSAARQQVFHRRALHTLGADQTPAAVLAWHALSAREWQTALAHCLSAGEDAMGLYEVSTARKHFEDARRLVNEEHVEITPAEIHLLYAQLGTANELEILHGQALAVYLEMEAQALERGDRKMELSALVAMALVLPLPYEIQDIAHASRVAEKAALLAREAKDQLALAQIELSFARIQKYGDRQIVPAIAHLNEAYKIAHKAELKKQSAEISLEMSVLLTCMGDLDQARTHLQGAFSIYEEMGMRSRMQDVLHNLGLLYMGEGEFGQALEYLDQAQNANKALENPSELLALLLSRNVIHILRGEYDLVFENLRPYLEGVENLVVPFLQVEIHYQLAWCYYDLGAYQQGLGQAERSVQLLQHAGNWSQSIILNMLSLLMIEIGETEKAATAIELFVDQDIPNTMVYASWWEGLPLLFSRAAVAFAQDDLNGAKKSVNELLDLFERLKLRHHRPSAYLALAEAHRESGEVELAIQTLTNSISLCDEIGIHREVWKMCGELAALERQRGNHDVAEKMLERAREEAVFISQHAGDPELAEGFLARSDVQNLMNTK